MSSRLPSEQPPAFDQEDQEGTWDKLREWLARMMILINGMMSSHIADLDPHHQYLLKTRIDPADDSLLDVLLANGTITQAEYDDLVL